MTKTVKVPDPVHQKAAQIAEERDISIKAAFDYVFNEAGYDV